MRFITAVVLVSSLIFVLILSSLTPAPYANKEILFQEDVTATPAPRMAVGPDGGVLLAEVPRLDGYTIYFTEASGEASRFDRSDFGMSRLAGLLQRLGADLITLNWNRDVPDDADLIVIAGPTNNLTADQSARLWAFVNRGGRVLLVTDPLATQFDRNGVLQISPNRALTSGDGFFQLTWADLGIRARDEVVAILRESEIIQPFPDQPAEGEPTPTPLPVVETAPISTELITSSLDATHPITAGLQGELVFFGARPIEFDSSIQLFDTRVLIFSGEEAYGESNYRAFLEEGIVEYNVGDDLAQGPQALVAVVEDDRKGTRIVLVGDREFVTNGGGFKTSPPSTAGFVHPNNVRFALNTIVWLLEAETEEHVEFFFPTPGPTATRTPMPTVTPTPPPTATPEIPDEEADDSETESG